MITLLQGLQEYLSIPCCLFFNHKIFSKLPGILIMAFIDKVFSLIKFCLKFTLDPIFHVFFILINGYKGRSVSRPRDKLLLKPAIQLAKEIRERKITSEEVTQAFIERIKIVNPIINAMVADRFDMAMDEAKAIDLKIADGSIDGEFPESSCPFLGVPFTAKEAIHIEGLPNSGAIHTRAGHVSSADAPTVTRLRQAGGIPLCVTNISELCMWAESNNTIYGRTNNPYDSTKNVGGSSGGEGALIAAAGSVYGIGSDIGGSIRLPCFYNGIFGHKPSRRIVPNDGQWPQGEGKEQDYLVTGPMVRYIEDLRPMFSILAGADKTEELKLMEKIKIESVEVVYMTDCAGRMVAHTDPEIQAALMKCVTYLTSLGCYCKPCDIKLLHYGFEIWSTHMDLSGGQSFCDLMSTNKPKPIRPVLEIFKWFINASKHTMPALLLAAAEKLLAWIPHRVREVEKIQSMAGRLDKQLEELLGGSKRRVLLIPTQPDVALRHSELLVCRPLNFAYTGVFNIMGVPATAVPLGLHSTGVPLGLQVVSARGNDALCLTVAEALAQGPAGWVQPYS